MSSLLRTKIERLTRQLEGKAGGGYRKFVWADEIAKRLRAALNTKEPPRPRDDLKRAAEAAHRYDGLGV